MARDLGIGAGMAKNFLIVNPRSAGGSTGRHFDDIAAAARAAVGECDHVFTERPRHAEELTREALRRGARLVVAVGGDGTANEAANGLVGTDTALWCLPAGSTNVFSRTVGTPGRLDEAAAALARAAEAPELRRMSTGTVDDRHFLFMSGIGVTAAVMRRAAERPVLRAKLGAGYVAFGAAAALADAGLGRLPRVTVEAAGRREEAATLIVQRSDPLTYFGRRPVSVCPPEPLGDGTLSVAMAARASATDVVQIFGRLLRGDGEHITSHPSVQALERLPGLRVRSSDGRPFALEVDGTYVGERTAVEYGVAPGSLLVAGT
jgi:diacylglycerol kinase family enzyme